MLKAGLGLLLVHGSTELEKKVNSFCSSTLIFHFHLTIHQEKNDCHNIEHDTHKMQDCDFLIVLENNFICTSEGIGKEVVACH